MERMSPEGSYTRSSILRCSKNMIKMSKQSSFSTTFFMSIQNSGMNYVLTETHIDPSWVEIAWEDMWCGILNPVNLCGIISVYSR